MTPYQAFTGKMPDLSKLQIFGAKVYCRETGLKQADIFDKLRLSEKEKSEFQALFRLAKMKKQRKLTRKVLQELDTWEEWDAQEFKQLDDYDAQDTFGPPQDPPSRGNLLSLFWVYLVKDDGQRRHDGCVCKGAKNRCCSVKHMLQR